MATPSKDGIGGFFILNLKWILGDAHALDRLLNSLATRALSLKRLCDSSFGLLKKLTVWCVYTHLIHYWTRYIQDNHLELISILAEQLSGRYVRLRSWLIRVLVLFCLLGATSNHDRRFKHFQTTPTPIKAKKSLIWIQPSQMSQRKYQRKDNSTHYLHSLYLFEGRS